MSLLLMSKRAEHPFYFEKLNIRLWSAEELAYCIVHYPLLALDGLVTENLIAWIGGELGAALTAEELENRRKAGESVENLLLGILQVANYYTQAEIRSFRNQLLELGKLPKAELYRETAKTYYKAGRLHQAAEKYTEAAKELVLTIRNAKTEEEAFKVNEKKADVLCDLACVRMLLFDETAAMKALDLAEETGNCQRAEEYRYLISGAAQLSEEEKMALEEKRRNCRAKAEESPMCRKVRKLSGKDREEFTREAASVIREWKREYRKSS